LYACIIVSEPVRKDNVRYCRQTRDASAQAAARRPSGAGCFALPYRQNNGYPVI